MRGGVQLRRGIRKRPRFRTPTPHPSPAATPSPARGEGDLARSHERASIPSALRRTGGDELLLLPAGRVLPGRTGRTGQGARPCRHRGGRPQHPGRGGPGPCGGRGAGAAAGHRRPHRLRRRDARRPGLSRASGGLCAPVPPPDPGRYPPGRQEGRLHPDPGRPDRPSRRGVPGPGSAGTAGRDVQGGPVAPGRGRSPASRRRSRRSTPCPAPPTPATSPPRASP